MPTYQELLDDHLARLERDLAVRLANPSPGDKYWFELQAKRIGGLATFSGDTYAIARLSELRLRFVEVAVGVPSALVQDSVESVRSDSIAIR